MRKSTISANPTRIAHDELSANKAQREDLMYGYGYGEFIRAKAEQNLSILGNGRVRELDVDMIENSVKDRIVAAKTESIQKSLSSMESLSDADFDRSIRGSLTLVIHFATLERLRQMQREPKTICMDETIRNLEMKYDEQMARESEEMSPKVKAYKSILEGLSFKDRLILALRFKSLEGLGLSKSRIRELYREYQHSETLPHSEIAIMLKISENAATTRYSRAVVRAQVLLEKSMKEGVIPNSEKNK